MTVIYGPSCHDFGQRPGCLGEADERYTMRFDAIGEPSIYWCAHCGPEAQAVAGAIEEAQRERPGFAESLAEAMGAAEAEMRAKAN